MARTRRTRVKQRNIHSNSPAASSSANSTVHSKRSAAIAAANASKAASSSGRNTQNSKGNRGRRGGPGPSGRKNPAISRGATGRGRGRGARKDASTLQDPTSYKDETTGEIYRKGGVIIFRGCKCL